MSKQNVYAVEHSRGLSLIAAKSGKEALKRAEKMFGTTSGPYTLPKDQVLEIVNAKSMGAGVQ